MNKLYSDNFRCPSGNVVFDEFIANTVTIQDDPFKWMHSIFRKLLTAFGFLTIIEIVGTKTSQYRDFIVFFNF